MRIVFCWAALAGCVLTSAYSLSACTVVPAHDGLARVPVDSVVKRVKCEIATAIIKKAITPTADGRRPYAFLLGWAAKLHFTVTVDDMASVNPGATFIHALHPAGSVPQNFSLGVGAGLTTEAVRQEDYEYLMSFGDLAKDDPPQNLLYQYCTLPDGLLLDSNLGVGDLVNNALKPIEKQLLYPGNNFGPGALPPPTTTVHIPDAKQQIAGLKNSKRNNLLIEEYENPIDNQAKELEKRAQAIVNNVVKSLYSVAASTSLDPHCLAGITFDQDKAIVASADLSSHVVQVYQAATSDKQKFFDLAGSDFAKVVNFANKMIDAYKACATEKYKNRPKVYDPIDAIAETINFYVTASGNETPTWKLVTVTAPLAPTFASAQRKDTNTLILSLGRPVISADGSVSASQAMNNQVLASLLSQAVAQRPAP